MSRPEGRPPRLARAMLDRLLPPADPGTATGDLDEEYTRYVLPERGRRAADRWYWRQVLRSAPGLLRRRLAVGVGLDGWAGDVRFAVRVLRRRRGTTAAVVLTMALCLGVATTVYSVVHAVLLAPLPYAEPDRLVRPLPDQLFYLDASDARLLEERVTAFAGFATYGRSVFLFVGPDDAEEVRGARVSYDHFDVLGVAAELGRTFRRTDADEGGVVVLGHDLWTRRFGADPWVVGSTVQVGGGRLEVIGVLPAHHVPLERDWEAWSVLPLDPGRVGGLAVAGFGRLRAGVTAHDAEVLLRGVLPEVWAEAGHATSPEERAVITVAPLRDWLLGDAATAAFALAVGVAALLLLASVNVVTLLTAQARARSAELAVRAALGGSRLRLARQAVVEVVLLCGAGGGLALVASWWGITAFGRTIPAAMPRVASIEPSGPVLLFALGATAATALVTGALPALRSRGPDLSRRLGSARAGRGRDGARARALLVGAQMALAVTLVVAAGLTLRTLASLKSVDPGFDPNGVVTVRPAPPGDRYPPQALDRYYGRLEEEVGRLPSVRSVGGIQFLPMTPGGWWSGYGTEGRPPTGERNARSTAVRVVRGAYFEAMRIPVVAGRPAVDGEVAEGAPIAVSVNQAFVRDAFPDGEAVGRTVELGEKTLIVVAVVGDVHQSDLRTRAHPEVYLPFAAEPVRRMHVVARHNGDEGAVVTAIAGAVRAVDARVALLGPRTVASVVDGTIGDTAMVALLLTLFGAVGLTLGAVGVYGVTARSVVERRREIGIRLALGAARERVARSTVIAGLTPVVVGAAVGLGVAAFASRLMKGLLFGVAVHDPITLIGAPVTLLAVALAALSVPALRATRIDPVRTLRDE